MISYLFPPAGGSGAAGSQRALRFAKYLPRHGWEPIVLTVKERCYEPYVLKDQTLLDLVPESLTVVRTSMIRWLMPLLRMKQRLAGASSGEAQRRPGPMSHGEGQAAAARPRFEGASTGAWYQELKDALTDVLEIPDEEMGWLLPGTLAGIAAVRRHGIDAVYSTGKPWTALVIGTLVKRFTGKPLVSDFRDPWMTNPFRNQHSAMKDALERTLERVVIRRSDVVIANTQELRDEFKDRFPWKNGERFACVLNGFDPEDYAGLEGRLERTPRVLTITHSGFLYGKRDPRTLFLGLRLALDRGDIPRDGVKLELVGSAELPYDLPAYLRDNELDDVVVLHQNVPYRQSLEHLERADLLLLLQPGTRTQIPSKLYEYVGMRRPILAVAPLDGATARMVSRDGLGIVVEADRVAAIADALANAYRGWCAGTPLASGLDLACTRYNSNNNTAALAQILSGVLERPGT